MVGRGFPFILAVRWSRVFGSAACLAAPKLAFKHRPLPMQGKRAVPSRDPEAGRAPGHGHYPVFAVRTAPADQQSSWGTVFSPLSHRPLSAIYLAILRSVWHRQPRLTNFSNPAARQRLLRIAAWMVRKRNVP